MSDAEPESPHGHRRLVRVSILAIVVIALAVRLWSPGPTTETYDENLWLHRSGVFATALADGNFSKASAGDPALGLTNPTMPGVTTMWAGVAGRQIARASGALGLSAPVNGPSQLSPQVLRAAQSMVSVFCVALLALLMVLLVRLFDARTALLTGALLAVEPWLVGLSHVLHTDALVMMFSITSLCALAYALHGDERGNVERTPAPRSSWLLVAAATAAGALLTKTNAVGIVAPGMALIAWDAWRHRYQGRTRELARAAGIGLATMAVVSIVAWPALIAAPLQQVQLMFDASKQVGKTRTRFFDGSIRGFIPQFYVVALAFRLSPWMIGWALIGLGGGLADLARRVWPNRFAGRPMAFPQVPTWVLLSPVPYFVVISLSRFGYDRYALAVVPFGVIAGACVLSRVSRRISFFRDRSPGVLVTGGLALVLAATSVPLRHAPYGPQYVNGILGGEATAIHWIPVESGQVSARLDADLVDLVEGNCSETRVADAYIHPATDQCGTYFTPQNLDELRRADYAFTFRIGPQHGGREWFYPWLSEHAELVRTVDVNGVSFGQLWKLPDSPQ